MKTKIEPTSAKKSGDHKDLIYKSKLLYDLMDNAPDVIYFKDKRGRLIMVNQAHAKGLGLRPEEVIGKTDFDIFPKKRAEKMNKDDMYVIRTGKPIIDKIERATRADKIDNYVSTTKIPRYDDKGRVVGLIGITRDITRRMQLERIKEEKEHLEQKLQAAEELNRTKSEFISVVSHELRVPLAIIKEAVMLISDEIPGIINEKQRELLLKAINNIKRLRHIIDELLDISKIESSRFKLHYSLINLNDLLRDSSAYFKKQAQHTGINLEYRLPRRHINIFIDAEKINQVILNLINNAIKFTEQGGNIKVEVKTLESKVRVGVIDTGIGIAKHNLGEIFNKFVQVSRLASTKTKGLGLGLSISKDLVEKHDGEIWAESRLGIGSKFYFTLPRFYTTSILEKHVRNRINNLLDERISVYLINLLIVNFREFRKMLKTAPGKLFNDLKDIINTTFSELRSSGRGKPQIVMEDIHVGEYGIVLPGGTEKKAVKICSLLKDNIKEYFTKNKIGNVFVNVGFLPYPQKGKSHTTLQLLASLYIKKIYIGSELRRFKRMKYNTNIEVILPKNKTESSQTIDLSLGGACFETKRPLETDKKVNVKLQLPLRKEPLHINGRVAWIKKIEKFSKSDTNKYKVGVEFTSLKDKKTLSKFIKSIPV